MGLTLQDVRIIHAESEGFEPPETQRASTVFKTAAFDHSANSPLLFQSFKTFSTSIINTALLTFQNIRIIHVESEGFSQTDAFGRTPGDSKSLNGFSQGDLQKNFDKTAAFFRKNAFGRPLCQLFVQ